MTKRLADDTAVRDMGTWYALYPVALVVKRRITIVSAYFGQGPATHFW